jgi:EmrB/QacA subfamily drug resistance transporter
MAQGSSGSKDSFLNPGLMQETNKWWVLIAVGISTFMSALDTSVVNTVLPVLRDSLGSNVAIIEWVVIIYLLVVSGLLLSFGRLGDLRGHRPVFLVGFVFFVTSSALCGLSQSTSALIAFRALQALGAAMLSANSPAILTKSFPDSQRGQALGLQATMTYLGLTVGPSLGGWLTDQFSWRAVFFINLPVGILALALSYRFVPHDEGKHTDERFDLAGASLFMTGLIALLLGLNQGHAWGWLSWQIVSLIITAVFLLAIFLRTERRVPSPMVDLSLFSNWLFSASVASAILNYVCVYAILFLMPFYLIQGRQFDPSYAGLLLTAMPIMMAIVAPLSGTLSDRVGARLPGTVGMALLAGGMFFLSRLGFQSPTMQIVRALALAGLGIGVFISPNNSALMGSAPRHRQGIAAGVLATARSVGMVLGVGLAGAIFTTVLEQRPTELAGGLFDAVQISFLFTTVVALAGMLTSAVRGNGREKSPEDQVLKPAQDVERLG